MVMLLPRFKAQSKNNNRHNLTHFTPIYEFMFLETRETVLLLSNMLYTHTNIFDYDSLYLHPKYILTQGAFHCELTSPLWLKPVSHFLRIHFKSGLPISWPSER